MWPSLPGHNLRTLSKRQREGRDRDQDRGGRKEGTLRLYYCHSCTEASSPPPFHPQSTQNQTISQINRKLDLQTFSSLFHVPVPSAPFSPYSSFFFLVLLLQIFLLLFIVLLILLLVLDCDNSCTEYTFFRLA